MQKFIFEIRASLCELLWRIWSKGLCESDWGIDINLGGWVGNVGILDLGELWALHVLLQSGEVAHALVEGLKMSVCFPGLSASNMVAEVEVLKENKIGDDWLGASQELPSVFEEIADLIEAIEGLLNNFCSVVLFKAQHSIVDHDVVGEKLQLVCSSLFLWSGAKSRWQILSSDVLVNGESLRQLHIAINDVGQVAEGHERLFVLAPVRGSPHVGSLFPSCAAVGEHEARNVSAAATAQVQVSENDFVATCLFRRSGS